MRILMKVFLVSLFFFSCKSEEEEVLKDRIDFLIENIDENDISDLYGFSSTSRAFDDEGNRYLREILYVNKNKESYRIPSFQTIKYKQNLSSYDFVSFGKQFNLKRDESILFARKIAKQMVKIFSDHRLYSMRNFKYQGQYIEFGLTESQKVYFVSDKGILDLKMNQRAYQIKPNWYITRTSEKSKKLIELYSKN